MLTYILQKLRSKKWLVLSLFIGNLLLVSIASANPIYTKAVLQKTLTRSLADHMQQKGSYPALVTLSATKTRSLDNMIGKDEFFKAEAASKEFSQSLGVPLLYHITNYYMENIEAVPLRPRSDLEKTRVTIASLSGIEDHIQLLAGEGFSGAQNSSTQLEGIVSEKALIGLNLLLGEELTLKNLLDENGDPFSIKIVGVYQSSDPSDPYWVRLPSGYSSSIIINEGSYMHHFIDAAPEPGYSMRAYWYSLFDYRAFKTEHTSNYLAALNQLSRQFPSTGSVKVANTFSNILTSYEADAREVTVTLWIMQVPIFVLLAAFIFMVSRQMLEMEQSEIAVIKSRGASKMQILGIYLGQSLIITTLAAILGVPLGLWLCQVLGSANAFLEFVQRSALPAQIEGDTLLFAGGAALVSVLTTVLPALRFADTSIVGQKRARQRSSAFPLWQKLCIDLVLLGISLYGLYSFNQQKDLLTSQVAQGISLDPLIYLSSSLFILGAALLGLRLIPLLVRLVYTAFKPLWSPALLASFLRVLRTRGSQGFIMVFLMITIALGIFNSVTARTLNHTKEVELRYLSGADVTLREVWRDNSQQLGSFSEGSAPTTQDKVYYEPDFNKFSALTQAKSITKVLNDTDALVSLQSGSNLRSVQLMGIHTKQFGETAWFDDSLLPTHWYNYLNAISQEPSAVLVCSAFKDHGFELGDTIYFRNADNQSARGVIRGFVPQWPGFAPISQVRQPDGSYISQNNFLIVANLAHLQQAFGITPYEVWLRVDGSTQFVYDFANEQGLAFQSFEDVNQKIIEMKNDPIQQGTNGILTVSFIVVLLLCIVGFLIYWILSIQSRALQMGIFRAMGMTMGEIIQMLLGEQLCISALSIAFGAGIGVLCARLFVPLIQLAYSGGQQAIPMQIVADPADAIRLICIVGISMVACLVILGLMVSKMKISQALKLGED